MNKIWTMEMRKIVCKGLLNRFGSLDEWYSEYVPVKGEGTKPLFDFYEEMAKALSIMYNINLTAGAVEMQVRYSLYKPHGVLDRGRVYTYIMCKAAAMEVGLINSGNLTSVSFDKKE